MQMFQHLLLGSGCCCSCFCCGERGVFREVGVPFRGDFDGVRLFRALLGFFLGVSLEFDPMTIGGIFGFSWVFFCPVVVLCALWDSAGDCSRGDFSVDCRRGLSILTIPPTIGTFQLRFDGDSIEPNRKISDSEKENEIKWKNQDITRRECIRWRICCDF